MAQLDKIRLSGITYDIIDATAIHSLDGYYTTGETNAAITAATNALAESIAEQGYQTSGDVQNAISGKADSSAVTQEISAAVSGKADTTAVTEAISEAVSGKANVEDAVTNLSFAKQNGQNTLLFSLQKNGSWSSGEAALSVGTGLTMDDKTVQVDFTKVAKPSDIPSVTGYADAVAYDTNSKEMKFYHGGTGGTEVFAFDASPFLIDGMVQNVEIKNVAGSGTCLVISFNTDAGKQDINIPISDIFDASNYYTKAEVDGELSGKTDNTAFTAYTAATDTALGNKADTTAMTQAISEATSGKVDNSTYTAYTSATDTAIAGKANTADVVTSVSGYSESGNKFEIYQTKGGSNTRVGTLSGGTGIDIYRAPGSTYIDKIEVNTNTIQEKLTSGTNIKTINNESILGSGNITVEGGNKVEVSGTTLVFL